MGVPAHALQVAQLHWAAGVLAAAVGLLVGLVLPVAQVLEVGKLNKARTISLSLSLGPEAGP